VQVWVGNALYDHLCWCLHYVTPFDVILVVVVAVVALVVVVVVVAMLVAFIRRQRRARRLRSVPVTRVSTYNPAYNTPLHDDDTGYSRQLPPAAAAARHT